MLTCFLYFLGANCQTPREADPLVVFASHDLPTKYESELLATPVEKLGSKAEQSGYVIEELEGLKFVRNKNLYNLSAMDEILDGVSGLIELIRGGRRSAILGKLNPTYREGVRNLLASSTVGFDLGPLSTNDACQLSFEATVELTLKNGSKEVKLTMPQPASEKLSDDYFQQMPTKDEMKKWEEETRPKFALKPYTDRLMFSFKQGSWPAATKASAAEAFSKRISENLESQRKRFQTLQDSIQRAFLGDSKLPLANSSFKAIDERTQESLRNQLIRNRSFFGFSTDSQAKAFFDEAMVKGTSVRANIFVGVLNNGRREMHGSAFGINRNP